MSLPDDLKVFQACQILDSKTVTCREIDINNLDKLIVSDESCLLYTSPSPRDS